MIELLPQFIGDFDGYSHNAGSLIVHMETCQIVAMVHVPVSASIRNPHPFQAIALHERVQSIDLNPAIP